MAQDRRTEAQKARHLADAQADKTAWWNEYNSGSWGFPEATPVRVTKPTELEEALILQSEDEYMKFMAKKQRDAEGRDPLFTPRPMEMTAFTGVASPETNAAMRKRLGLPPIPPSFSDIMSLPISLTGMGMIPPEYRYFPNIREVNAEQERLANRDYYSHHGVD